MKTNRFIAVFILIALSFSFNSCKDGFLTEHPKDFLSPTNFYSSEGDATAALIASYSGLRTYLLYGQNLYFIGDMPSEQTNYGTGSNVDRININNFVFEPTNSISSGVWDSSYDNINRTNAVIGRVPQINMNSEKRAIIVAEARFLRALNYFNLVRIFGGVPLRLEETTSLASLDIARSPVGEVYNTIIADLKEAENVLPNQWTASDIGRATKGAASTLLAYVYLTNHDWKNAAAKAQEVINNKSSYGYDLFSNYADLWKIGNKNKLEHIFMVQYQSGPDGMGSAYTHFFMSRQANAILLQGSGYAIHLVEEPFWKSFDTKDTRRDASILSSFIDPKTQKVISYPTGLTELSIFKYYDPAPFARSNTSNNYPILRYADVLLIKAEALNEINGPTTEAYEAINIIRRRANLQDLAPGKSQQEFRDAVLQERSWEFCFESKRYFDLTRTEKLVPIMTAAGKNPQPKNLLFPIPQREIDINKKIEQADQNPGY